MYIYIIMRIYNFKSILLKNIHINNFVIYVSIIQEKKISIKKVNNIEITY